MGYRRESANPEQVVQRTRDNSCTNNRKKGCVHVLVVLSVILLTEEKEM